jgi:hypothetical protein
LSRRIKRFFSEFLVESIAEGTSATVPDADRPGDDERNEGGAGVGGERNEDHAVGEITAELGRNLEREPSLADAARAGQRHQAVGGCPGPTA